MSNKYKTHTDVPDSVLVKRLKELSSVVTKGSDVVVREFIMSIPAELDHDPDLVLSIAAMRITELRNALLDVKNELEDDPTLGYHKYALKRCSKALRV